MLISIAAGALALIAVGNPQADCPAISDPTERLECYDRVAGRVAGDPEEPVNYRVGSWLVALRSDLTTGEETIGLAVTADATPGSELRAPTLLFRCVGGAFGALTDWETFLRRGGEEAEIVIQIDSQREQAARWVVSADGTTTFVPDDEDDALFSSLYFAERLELLVTREDDSPLLARFNVSGLIDAAPVLWRECPPR